MKKYEYKMVYMCHSDLDGLIINNKIKGIKEDLYCEDLVSQLNEFGNDGWELISLDESFLSANGGNGYVIFKRKI